MIEVVHFQEPVPYRIGDNIYEQAEQSQISSTSEVMKPGVYDFTPAPLTERQTHKLKVYSNETGLYIVTGKKSQVLVYQKNNPLQSTLRNGYRARIPDDQRDILIGAESPFIKASQIVYTLIRYRD